MHPIYGKCCTAGSAWLSELVFGYQRAATSRPSSELLRQAQSAVDAFVEDLGADEVAISPEIGRRARDACAAYGKGVGHLANLNSGDCFAYACAKALNVGLLHKGNDFLHTDLA